ncbi:MAG TPA: hypothetical protein VF297_26555 [Pyrinomonadaceae bacterium]
MITFRITGTVKVAETGVGLPGLFVKAYDKDILFDDLLGSAVTGEGGAFEIISELKDFRDFFEQKPDIYLKVYTRDGKKQIHAVDEGIRWGSGKVENFEVLIPLKSLGKNAPPRNVGLLDERGEARTSYDPGESLVVNLKGLEANTVHDLTLSDEKGAPLFTSTLLSNLNGEIEPTLLWAQFGLTDPRTDERFTVAQARKHWKGRSLTLQVKTRGKAVLKQSIKIADTFKRPFVLNTDPEGYVLNSFEVGRNDALVSAYNLPFSGTARVYMVPRQHNWFTGNTFAPVELASGRAAFADAEVGSNRSLSSVRLARAKELRPGAYDFIIRELRYGYEDDEVMTLRESDVVTRMVTGLVVRWEFMAWKAVLGGCTNTQPISGRSVTGAPYFQFADTFQPGEKVYGALDPAALSPDQKGKMVALYVVQRPVADYLDLHHLPQLGGNAAVQKIFTQTGCINQNKVLLWNSAEVGDYDIIADFGNNTADPNAFLPDAAHNQPLDMVDGKLLAGFRVVADPGTATNPGIPHSGSFGYTEAQQGTININDPHSGMTTVNLVAEVRFPAALAGVTDPAQISNFAASYPLIVCVHGNGHNFSNYTYLLDHWAKNGFIAASIHLNNGMAKEGRARVMFKHIEILKATFGTHVQNKIGIMGHSRGGEGVVAAARINQTEALNHGIKAIISLAPTDQYFPREILAAPHATPYLVMHGAMDGDVANAGFQGFSLYDRASGEPKSMAWLYGANHNRFNEVNPDGDLNTGKMDPADHPKILTAASHKVLALAYMTGFFRWQLYDAVEYQGMFRGEWTPPSVAQAEPAINKIYFQYGDPSTSVVDNFEQLPHDWQTGTNVAVNDSNTLPVDPQEDALATLDTHSSQDTAGLLLRWDTNTDRLVFTPAATLDVSNFNAVSFRVGQKVDSVHNTANQPQDLYLTLTDATNKSRSIRVDAFGDVPPQQKRVKNQFTISALTTVRIPLHVFQTEVINTQKVDLTQIQTVAFDFKANNSGEIEIDSVEFTD